MLFSRTSRPLSHRAGYSAKTARVTGAQNLSKLNISAAIEKARTTHAVRAELNADMVIEELRKIAFANLADYLSAAAPDFWTAG